MQLGSDIKILTFVVGLCMYKDSASDLMGNYAVVVASQLFC